MGLIITLLAGIMNGSFAVPTKYISKISHERVWKYHSFIGLIIIPWVFLLLLAPNSFNYYKLLSPSLWYLLIVSGFIFGLGQIFFSYAIEKIGVASSFSINLGIGVVIGSMFVVYYKNSFITTHGLLVTIAVFTIFVGLATYYFSNLENSSLSLKKTNYSSHQLGWFLAILAGFSSGLQNIAFILMLSKTQNLLQENNNFWIWPPFLLAASIPMLIGLSYKEKQKIKNKNIKKQKNNLKELLLIIVMGILFTGSLVLYSYGVSHLSNKKIIIAWPTFMVAIILVTQLWGSILGENKIHKKNSKLKWISIILLIASIILLAIA